MKTLVAGWVGLSLLTSLSLAAERPALVEKHDIQLVKGIADPTLRSFKNSLARTYDTDGDYRLWLMSAVLKIGNKKSGFSFTELVQLLNGRINDSFEVDLTISDRDAQLNDIVVTEAGYLGSYKPRTERFVDHFLPSTASEARDLGFSWTQKDLDRTSDELRALMAEKHITTYLINMENGGDSRIRFLAFHVYETGELLLLGFASNP